MSAAEEKASAIVARNFDNPFETVDGEERYTEAAQDLFNDEYDAAYEEALNQARSEGKL